VTIRHALALFSAEVFQLPAPFAFHMQFVATTSYLVRTEVSIWVSVTLAQQQAPPSRTTAALASFMVA
jgi:hypothetical protein